MCAYDTVLLQHRPEGQIHKFIIQFEMEQNLDANSIKQSLPYLQFSFYALENEDCFILNVVTDNKQPWKMIMISIPNNLANTNHLSSMDDNLFVKISMNSLRAHLFTCEKLGVVFSFSHWIVHWML